MLLLIFLVLGLFIGLLRGGGLSGLAGARLRWLWMLILAALAEFSVRVLPNIVPQLFPAILPILQILRYAPLLLFALLNLNRWQIAVAGLGVLMNLVVIGMNGWRMPVSAQMLSVPGLASAVEKISTGVIPEYFVMSSTGGATLWYLSDIIPLWFIHTGFASIGDMVMGLGVLLFVQHAMARYSYGKHARNSQTKQAFVAAPESGRRRGKRSAAPAGRRTEPEITAAPVVKREDPPAPAPVWTAPAPAPASAPEPEPATVEVPQAAWGAVQPRPADPGLPAEGPLPQTSARPIQPDRPLEPPVVIQRYVKPAAAEPAPVQPAAPVKKEQPVRAAAPFNPPYKSAQPAEKPEVELLSEWKAEEPAVEPGRKENPVRLTPRLAAVASMIDRYAVVADVGCDHGKLAAWLAVNGAPRVVAMDISSKSLSKTRELVKELDLHNVVQTRVSDGLKKLRSGEADNIVIAGLGGPTICTILEKGRAVAGSAAKLVLQPMNAIGAVRRYLVDNGYCIVGEELAQEEGRIYQILSAVPGSDGTPPMSVFDLEVGHLLIENRHPLLQKLLEDKIRTIDSILGEIAGNDTPRAEARRSELSALRERCKEELKWAAR